MVWKDYKPHPPLLLRGQVEEGALGQLRSEQVICQHDEIVGIRPLDAALSHRGRILSDVASHDSGPHLTRHLKTSHIECPLGLYDMSGNVEEWTRSYYTESYAADSKVDYLRRVLRGGSVASRYADLVSVSNRQNAPENQGMPYYGLRLVLNIPQGAASGVEDVRVGGNAHAALVRRGGSLLIRGVDARLTDLSGRPVKD